MCTMTWFLQPQGYELFFNRDERVSRSKAKSPSLLSTNGVEYISPTDPDGGGTWIATNELGVTVCLLNHYQFEQIATYKEWKSRGQVVRQFAATSSLSIAREQFSTMSLLDYRAFRMFILWPSGKNLLCVWDGHSPRIESNVSTPKSSSSVSAQDVKAARKDLFANKDLHNSTATEDFIDFHRSHYPDRSEQSVCMHRPDANTVSLSVIKVDQDEILFSYADGSPCTAALSQPWRLARRNVEQAAVTRSAVGHR